MKCLALGSAIVLLVAPTVNAQSCPVGVLHQELDAGTAGPRLWAPDGAPVVGSPFSLQVEGGPAGSSGLLFLGRSETSLLLSTFGATVYPSDVFSIGAFALDGNGRSPLLVPMPALSSDVCGALVLAQAAVVDPSASGGMAVTNALRMRAGVADSPLFAVQTFPTLGERALEIVVADFDDDGQLDMATANYDTGDVSVFRGLGDGQFDVAQPYATGTGPRGLAAGDVDGDGALDLVVVNVLSEDVVLLRGQGDATFLPAQTLLDDRAFGGIAIGELNGDGIPDLVVSEVLMGQVLAVFGIGDGKFRDPFGFDVGAVPGAVALEFLDGDGVLDVVVANSSSDDVSVLLGTGSGMLAPAVSYPTGDSPEAVEVDDFDGDGAPDLAVVHRLSEDVSVLLGHGDGTFLPAVSYPVGNGGYDLAVGDLNGDAVPDLAVAAIDPNVLLGHGDGTFGAATSYPSAPSNRAIAAADVDADGDGDLLAVSWIDDHVAWLRGEGDGTFPVDALFTAGGIQDVAVGDFDGDGVPDVATANVETIGPTGAEEEGEVAVLLGNGDGSLAAPVAFPAGSGPSSASRLRLTVIDLDSDGALDIVVADYFGDQLLTFGGNGDGTFGAQTQVATQHRPSSIDAADLDQDGLGDLITMGALDDAVSVFLGAGGNAFAPAQTFAVGEGSVAFVVADLDGDDVLDLAAANVQSDDVSVLLGDGSGGFATETRFAAGVGPRWLAAGDFDGDAAVDLVVANLTSDDLTLLSGNGDGTFGPSQTHDATFPQGLVVSDFDGDGVSDVVVAQLDDVLVLRGAGGTLVPAGTFSAGGALLIPRVADLDRDGIPDLVGRSRYSPVELGVMLNRLGE